MNIITTLAAGVLMSPANVATDVQSHDFKNPEYDWKTQKAIVDEQFETEAPQKMQSVRGTNCYVGNNYTVDDWNTWD